MTTKHFVLVAGNIGAGKTSLTRKIGERLGWLTGFESVKDNPYLSDFYEDMAKWSFHLQIFYIGHRAAQHKELYDGRQSAISDRSIYEDAHIFARALKHMNMISDRDYNAYRRNFELVVENLPKPDLLLFLDCPVPVLVDRIKRRGRQIESGISAEYLGLLESLYKEWLDDFDLCPVLVVPSQNLDFVTRPEHLDIVVERIQDKLAGKENVVFPD